MSEENKKYIEHLFEFILSQINRKERTHSSKKIATYFSPDAKLISGGILYKNEGIQHFFYILINSKLRPVSYSNLFFKECGKLWIGSIDVMWFLNRKKIKTKLFFVMKNGFIYELKMNNFF